MIYARTILFLTIALGCVGCTGYVVAPVSLDKPEGAAGREDGAVVAYYLPKATWKFTASYDGSTGLITLTPDTKQTVTADTDTPMRILSYGHSQLSDDDFDIFFDGMTIKSIASKSSDQTVKIVEAANALITQAGSTAKAAALKVELVAPGTGMPSQLSDAGCTTNLKSELLVELSRKSDPTKLVQNDLLWSEHCALTLTATRELLSESVPFHGRALASSQNLATPGDPCERAICFRPSGMVRINVTVSLQSNYVKGQDKPVKLYTVLVPKPAVGNAPLSFTQTFGPVAVPIATNRLAFVEFSRRAFVENHTTIAFTDGVLTEFHSTDPSIIAGAVTLSSDLLKSVALTVPLVR